MPRLVVVEADGEDELLDLGDGETAEVVGSEAEGISIVRIPQKQMMKLVFGGFCADFYLRFPQKRETVV